MSNPRACVHRATWTWLCSISSSVLFLTLIALAAHIRIGLGRWPHFGEEYHSVLFGIQEFLSGGVLLFTIYAAAPLWLILLFFRKFRISWAVHFIQVLAYGFGWLLIFLAGKYDPTPFTNWLLD